jgi:hypothetical protein
VRGRHEWGSTWYSNAITTNLDMLLIERALYQERAQEHRLQRALERLDGTTTSAS